ncbi:hypothetical protein [Streptomyces wuyuanensis]|uniref:PE-PGRS family protein n=1 Tax=Streptomyces wuyuanensis TaxID=1196353 RepID=A0A1G9YYL1_9ACTN|nr:hypothetical protein [Streptomyces wuyuanensis]SDN14144.1 hypothetical protein SAMN05444921_12028 [Streptomyces wuyuanensis]
MTAGWCSRTVRAAVFAAVCVLLAALGHVMMSGQPVPWWTLSGGFGATGVLGWCLAGRERGRLAVLNLVVAAQTALHSAFSLAQSAAPTAGRVPHTTGPADHVHHHMTSAAMGPAHTDAVDGMSMGHTYVGHMGAGHVDPAQAGAVDPASLGMLAAHLAAALLTGLWLAYGERAAFRILRAVAGWLTAPMRLLLALPAPPHRPRLRGRRRPSRASRLLPLVYAIVSRGPPVGSAVA